MTQETEAGINGLELNLEELLVVGEEEVNGVRMKVYKNRMKTLRDLLAFSTAMFGDQECMVYQDQRFTFQEFGRLVKSAGKVLQDLGVRQGDRVAMILGNATAFPIVFFATASIGAISVPLNCWWKSEELEYGLSDSGSSVLVMDPKYWDSISQIKDNLPALKHIFVTGDEEITGTLPFSTLLAEPDAPMCEEPISEQDVASIFYTSGTTGRPKGAMTMHMNFITNVYNAASGILSAAPPPGSTDEESMEAARKQLLTVPMFHVTGCHSQLVTSIALGGTLVILRRFRADEAMEAIEKEKVSAMVGVPTMYIMMLDSPNFDKYDLSSLTSASYGGAPAPPDMVKRLHEAFPQLSLGNSYGLTETSSITTLLRGEDAIRKPDSVGKPAPVVEIKTVDLAGNDLPANEVGEILIKGPNIIKGYWNKSEATAETIIDGWLHTGDIGRIDEEGFLYVVDRQKDMILRGGENIYCVEIEDVLYEHPKVLEAAVIGVPDKTFGEQVKAIIYLRRDQEAKAEEIQEFCEQRLAHFKVPQYVAFIDSPLPRNPQGKVLKAELKQKFVKT
ncbi:MAG: long-chain-fatty-acid--CoA ligase [Deltaproteobacteria bacterium]|nr:long-chain-fatty-acid--CoA ligase [Deltaproteobacteria bacterium]MBW2085438.1 long-chain-fatty-acid--CoA ligase [Deltaproteobacteria bacterium]